MSEHVTAQHAGLPSYQLKKKTERSSPFLNNSSKSPRNESDGPALGHMPFDELVRGQSSLID